jgi:phasin family protein
MAPVAPKAVEAVKPAPSRSAPARQAAAVKTDAPAPAKAAPRVVIPGAEALPRAIKDVAKTNVAQARDAFATVRQSTEALAAGFGTGGEAAAKGIKSFQAALVEALQANTDATLGYWRSLGSVKTMSEAIELQAHTARKQFEALHAQAKTLAGIASRTAQETTAPVRQALDATLRRAS